MDHVAACESCDRFWRELQAAQALVLRLPRPRVNHDFRDQLFERIQTGEGTPPAVFHEPVPLAMKVRYTLTGAAAAAALLMAATLLRNKPEPERATIANLPAAVGVDQAALDARPAKLASGYTASADVRPLEPRGSATSGPADSLLSAVRPLTPDLVAVETAREFEQRFRWTTQLLNRTQDDATARTVCNNAAEIHDLGKVLVDLRDSKWLSFADPEVDADLRVIVTLLDGDRLSSSENGIDIVRSMVAPALRKSSSLERLTTTLSITPSFDRDRQQQNVERLLRTFPGVLDRIFLVLPNEPAAMDFDPRELSRMFVLQDACGPVYVAPFREVRRLHNR